MWYSSATWVWVAFLLFPPKMFGLGLVSLGPRGEVRNAALGDFRLGPEPILVI